MYQALYRKYRPRRFEDVVGQNHVTDTLRRQVMAGRISHAYLFVGSRGTGKTTCAKILSRAINCENPQDGEPCNACPACLGILNGSVMDVVEIDAASNNGVENVRTLRDEAVYTPAQVKKRVYIIDEVHMLSNAAFNALLKIMEEPPEHLVFILATTELQKVPATVLSRCQRYSFRRLTAQDVEGRLRYVCHEEGITADEGAIRLLARLGDGAMRDSLSLLDQCLGVGEITEERVISAVGLAGRDRTEKLWLAVKNSDGAAAMEIFEELYYGGTEAGTVLTGLLSLLRDMLIARSMPQGGDRLLSGTETLEELEELSRGLSERELLSYAAALRDRIGAMASLRDRRTAAELAILELAAGPTVPAQRPQRPAQTLPPPRTAVSAPAPAARTQPSQPAQPVPQTPAPQAQERPQVQERPQRPARDQWPTQAQSGPAPQVGPWWEEIKAALSMDIRAQLGGAEPERQPGQLILHSDNPMLKSMMDRMDRRRQVEDAASRVFGEPTVLRYAPAFRREAVEPGENDPIEALNKFSVTRYVKE